MTHLLPFLLAFAAGFVIGMACLSLLALVIGPGVAQDRAKHNNKRFH